MTSSVIDIHSTAELGHLIRKVRKDMGLTQQKAAALCNVSLPFLNGLERGKPTAQIDKVLIVCRNFGIQLRVQVPMDLGETR